MKLDAISSSFQEINNRTDLVNQEKIRINFREYFTYAIRGHKSNPIHPNFCGNNCLDTSYCCAMIFAIDLKTNLLTNDNQCMLKQVIHSFNNITLENVNYNMRCRDELSDAFRVKFLR